MVRKAHEELDAVVGRDRLPTFSDKPSLAYVNAIIAESFRYHNALPLGAPHRTINDDEFHGYFIPAGTVVQSNVWYVVPDSPSSRIVGLTDSTLFAGLVCMTRMCFLTRLSSVLNDSYGMANMTLVFGIQ